MRYAILFAFACCLSSCLPGRVVARTASDLAADLCRQYHTEKVGLSWEEAGEKFCSTHDDLKPFIDILLSQKQQLDEGPVGARAQVGK